MSGNIQFDLGNEILKAGALSSTRLQRLNEKD